MPPLYDGATYFRKRKLKFLLLPLPAALLAYLTMIWMLRAVLTVSEYPRKDLTVFSIYDLYFFFHFVFFGGGWVIIIRDFDDV